MLDRMKNEIINLENEDVHVLKKENWKNAVMAMFPFLLMAVTGMKINCFAGVTLSNIALVIIGVMFSIGCISSIRIKKDKKIFILFKSISIFLLSLGFMILTYSIVEQIINSSYVKELYFCMTGMIYIGIIIASYIYINRKIKLQIKSKYRKRTGLAIGGGCGVAGYCIGEILIKYLHYNTMLIIMIVSFNIVAFILAGIFPLYFTEYRFSRSLSYSQQTTNNNLLTFKKDDSSTKKKDVGLFELIVYAVIIAIIFYILSGWYYRFQITKFASDNTLLFARNNTSFLIILIAPIIMILLIKANLKYNSRNKVKSVRNCVLMVLIVFVISTIMLWCKLYEYTDIRKEVIYISDSFFEERKEYKWNDVNYVKVYYKRDNKNNINIYYDMYFNDGDVINVWNSEYVFRDIVKLDKYIQEKNIDIKREKILNDDYGSFITNFKDKDKYGNNRLKVIAEIFDDNIENFN